MQRILSQLFIAAGQLGQGDVSPGCCDAVFHGLVQVYFVQWSVGSTCLHSLPVVGRAEV